MHAGTSLAPINTYFDTKSSSSPSAVYALNADAQLHHFPIFRRIIRKIVNGQIAYGRQFGYVCVYVFDAGALFQNTNKMNIDAEKLARRLLAPSCGTQNSSVYIKCRVEFIW